MGSVTYLFNRRRPAAAFSEAPLPRDGGGEHVAGHIKAALDRYRRDLRLMLSREEQIPGTGVIRLDSLRAGRARRRLIGDRIVRIKTLEAMLELVLEKTEVHV